jgi:hypothetical protein
MSVFLGVTFLADRSPQRLVLLLGVAVFLLLTGSCASGRKPVYPVRGQVFVGGQPAAQAFVVLHPTDDDGPQATRPYGHAGADGSFTLTTYDQGDGAPAGEYVVTIVWLAPTGGEDPPDRLKGQYRDPKTSKLRASVQKGPTELAPFQLPR